MNEDKAGIIGGVIITAYEFLFFKKYKMLCISKL